VSVGGGLNPRTSGAFAAAPPEVVGEGGALQQIDARANEALFSPFPEVIRHRAGGRHDSGTTMRKLLLANIIRER